MKGMMGHLQKNAMQVKLDSLEEREPLHYKKRDIFSI